MGTVSSADPVLPAAEGDLLPVEQGQAGAAAAGPTALAKALSTGMEVSDQATVDRALAEERKAQLAGR